MNDHAIMDEQVLTPLNSLETSFNALITSLTTTPSYSNAPSAAQSLLNADDSLSTALRALYKHQKNYARIVQLRAEAGRLEEEIKDTIRSCVELRQEMGKIYPSILLRSDDSDDSDGGDQSDRDVDYHTLLSFASKLGKHNSAAAKAAEEEYIQRLIKARKEEGRQAKKTTESEQPRTNGSMATAHSPAPPPPTTPTATATATADGESALQNLIPQHEKDWLDAEAAMARARAGMAFPPAENLRKGALGRLQWVREQGGEEAVERELDGMISQAEGKPTDGRQGRGLEPAAGQEGARPAEAARPQQAGSLPSRPQQPSRPQERKKTVAVNLDLDLWNEDDDDDDDD